MQSDLYGNYQQQQHHYSSSFPMQQSPSHLSADLSSISSSVQVQRDHAALLGSTSLQPEHQYQHHSAPGTTSRHNSSNSESSYSGAGYSQGFPFQQQRQQQQTQTLQHHIPPIHHQQSYSPGGYHASSSASTGSGAATGQLRHLTPPVLSPSPPVLPGVAVAPAGLSPAAEGSLQGGNVVGGAYFQQQPISQPDEVLSSILSPSPGALQSQWQQPQQVPQPVAQRHFAEPGQHQQLYPVNYDLTLSSSSQAQHHQSYVASPPSSTLIGPGSAHANHLVQPLAPSFQQHQSHHFQVQTPAVVTSLSQPPQYQSLQLQQPSLPTQQQHQPMQGYGSFAAGSMVSSPPMHHAPLVPSMAIVPGSASGTSRSSPAHQMVSASMSPPKATGSSAKRKQYFIFGPNSYSLMVRYLLMQEGLLQRDTNTPKYPTVNEINTALQQDRRPIITKKRWSRLQGNLIVIPASQNTVPILLTPSTQALTSAATPGVTVAPFIGHDDPHNLTHRLPRGRRLKSSGGAGSTSSHPPPPPPNYSGLSIGGIGFPSVDHGTSVTSPPAGAVPPTFASQPMIATDNAGGFGAQHQHHQHQQPQQQFHQPQQQQTHQLPPSFGFADLGSGSDDDMDDDDDGEDPLADLGDEYAGPVGALPGGRPAHVPVPQNAVEALIQSYHLAWRGDTHLIVPRNMWPRIFRAAHQFVEHREDCPVIVAAAASHSGLPPANLMCNCVIRHRSLRDTLDAIKQHYQIRRSRCGITLAAVRKMFVQCTCCAVRGLSNV
ncbi:hypothetical protein BCR44DRAFT_63002 [Catenaria anguillulae PL171]|uniref:Uncharacterized protein n=1 Tax=Catenaria anguillulae PL171 TaxID=765915 RepID=A0A1Y2HR52_9FUNG|nr:hypothetical protein BCR44DRAFT_63002 [Catenaria anguillulae PL171]